MLDPIMKFMNTWQQFRRASKAFKKRVTKIRKIIIRNWKNMKPSKNLPNARMSILKCQYDKFSHINPLTSTNIEQIKSCLMLWVLELDALPNNTISSAKTIYVSQRNWLSKWMYFQLTNCWHLTINAYKPKQKLQKEEETNDLPVYDPAKEKIEGRPPCWTNWRLRQKRHTSQLIWWIFLENDTDATWILKNPKLFYYKLYSCQV